MKLFTFDHSPNPLKVRLALAELGLACERVEVNLFKREHMRAEFTAVTPLQAVPVLDDGPLRLRESNAILLHLAAKAGQEVGPAGHQWLFYESATLARPCGILWWSEVVVPATGFPGWDEAERVDAAEELEDALGLIEAHLAAAGPWFLGERFTVVDCSLGAILSMLRGTRLPLFEEAGRARWPRTRDLVERLQARPSWRAAAGEAIHRFA